eukprot:12092233-Ditylum_brightwellii.AAC.1
MLSLLFVPDGISMIQLHWNHTVFIPATLKSGQNQHESGCFAASPGCQLQCNCMVGGACY